MNTMSLMTNQYYDFGAVAQDVLSFMATHGLALFSIVEMIQSTNPNDEFVKVYVNYPNSMVRAHRPICPDGMSLVAGIGNATIRGFWVGLLQRSQIISKFSSIDNFLAQFSQAVGQLSHQRCQKCGA